MGYSPVMNGEDDGQDKWAYKVYRVEFLATDTIVVLVGYANAECDHLQMTQAVETMLKLFGRCSRCSRTIDSFDDHQPCLRTPDGARDFIPVELPASLFEHVNKEQKRERLRDKGRAASGRRKAALEQASERHTEAEIDKLYAFQQGRCYYCNAALVDDAAARKFTKDHFLAVMSGGGDGIHNIVLCCRPCNNSKLERSPYDFRREKLRDASPEDQRSLRALHRRHTKEYRPPAAAPSGSRRRGGLVGP